MSQAASWDADCQLSSVLAADGGTAQNLGQRGRHGLGEERTGVQPLCDLARNDLVHVRCRVQLVKPCSRIPILNIIIGETVHLRVVQDVIENVK